MLRIKTPLFLIVYSAALLGVAPVFLYLEPWTKLVFPLALLVGVVGDRKEKQLLSDRWATLLTIVVAAFCLLQISRSHFVEPIVNLLVLLQAVRLLGSKTDRHLLQIFLLAMFCLAASSLLTLTMAFLPLLIAMVFLVTIGLVLLTFRTQLPHLSLDRSGWRLVFWPAAMLPIGSLLLMLVFFVILPRTQNPIWRFLGPQPQAKIGLSEEVSPGKISSLSATTSFAFRAEMDEKDPLDLYWRTLVLNHTDGSVWQRRRQMPEDRLRNATGDELTVFLEPKPDQYLPVLNLPREISGHRSLIDRDRVIKSRWPIRKRISYRIVSIPSGSLVLADTTAADFYLQLPDRIDPRVTQVAEQASQAGDRQATIEHLKTFFRQQQLQYSSRDLPETNDPVSTFLFETRRGYCEYFASSFGLLLRLSGVPARLVGGYLGGNYNDWGGYYLVAENTAHVWVEALMEDGTWVRVDPSRLAQNSSAAFREIQRRDFPWTTMLMDSIEHVWNRAIINFDLDTQFELLRQTNQALRKWNWRIIPWQKAVSVLVGAVVGSFCLTWLFRRRFGVERRILNRYLSIVQKRFDFDPEGMGLFDIADRTGDPDCRRFAELYGGLVYRDRRFDPKTLHALQEINRTLTRN